MQLVKQNKTTTKTKTINEFKMNTMKMTNNRDQMVSHAGGMEAIKQGYE